MRHSTVRWEYHQLHNLGNNRGRVFYEPDNYLFFLRREGEYLAPVLETVAYFLMPTHTWRGKNP